MFGAFGVMTALAEREQTGRGRAVETSLLAAVTAVHAFHGAGWLSAGVEPGRTGNRHPVDRAVRHVPLCRHAVVIAVGSESLWRRFATVVGLDPEREDIATNALRVGRVEDLQAEIERLLADARPTTCSRELDAAGCRPAGSAPCPRSTTGSRCASSGWCTQMIHPVLGA